MEFPLLGLYIGRRLDDLKALLLGGRSQDYWYVSMDAQHRIEIRVILRGLKDLVSPGYELDEMEQAVAGDISIEAVQIFAYLGFTPVIADTSNQQVVKICTGFLHWNLEHTDCSEHTDYMSPLTSDAKIIFERLCSNSHSI